MINIARVKVGILYTLLEDLFVDKSNFLIIFKILDIKLHISDFSSLDFIIIGISVKIILKNMFYKIYHKIIYIVKKSINLFGLNKNYITFFR